MKTRIISGAVGLLLFAAAIVASIKIHPLILFVLITLVGAIAVYEALVNTGYVRSTFMAICCIIYALVVPFSYSGYIGVNHVGFIVFLGFLLLAKGMFDHKNVTPHDACYAFAITVIVTFCFWALAAVSQYADGHGLFYLILVVISAWGCDTGAYFTGYFLGKHKMAPEISPKKTIEGAIGGIITTMIIMLIVALTFNAMSDATANTVLLVALSPILAFAGMLGDLIASYIKRASGIKDYGKIMPGHGGVLDRFDSIITVVPLVYIMITNLPVLA